MICSIDGCTKRARSHGWCSAHHTRWLRHGDPLAGSTPRGATAGSPKRYYQETVLAYEGDDCLIWPFHRDRGGYARYTVKGVPKMVSRLVCEEEQGPPPTPEHEAAHSCGKGHEGCVTKGHLSWKTPAANQADRLAHGTVHFGEINSQSKLTNDDALRILMLRGQKSQREIAAMFGVNRRTVGRIHDGSRWGCLQAERGPDLRIISGVVA